jgi:thiosulfate dehydrogenase [quinone] large subunit
VQTPPPEQIPGPDPVSQESSGTQPEQLPPPWRAGLQASSSNVAWALLPLRAFLGFTFCFAGLQKLANPGFFNATNPGSIQSQLVGAARRSPIHALVTPLAHVAVSLGIAIALGELAVGLGTLIGLWARIAAAGGVALSLLLFLTVSFHSSPYYTGSDIVFVFAWTPLVLAGAGGLLSADALLAERIRRETDSGQARRSAKARALAEQETRRRTFVLKGTVTAALAVVGLAVGGLTAGIGRLAGGATSGSGTSALSGSPAASPQVAGPQAASSKAASSKAAANPAGTRIGPASAVPVGGAASFQAPSSGTPALVIQPKSGTFLAFDAVCPHAGCAVQYQQSGNLFICPCHGSQFNGTTGAVEVGPASTGLTPLTVKESSNGQLYVT